MNAFLRGHRVLAVKKEFVADGENSFWSFCVEYLDGAGAGALLPGGRPKIETLRHRGVPQQGQILVGCVCNRHTGKVRAPSRKSSQM